MYSVRPITETFAGQYQAEEAKNTDKRGSVPSGQRSSPHVGGDDGDNP